MKATAKNGTSSNIKFMDGGGAIATLNGGQYVFGDWSSAKTDIINFTKVYNADGSGAQQFQKPCKVFVGSNLIVTEGNEPTTPPDETDPTPDEQPIGLVPLTVTIEGEGYQSVTVDLIPNDTD